MADPTWNDKNKATAGANPVAPPPTAPSWGSAVQTAVQQKAAQTAPAAAPYKPKPAAVPKPKGNVGPTRYSYPLDEAEQPIKPPEASPSKPAEAAKPADTWEMPKPPDMAAKPAPAADSVTLLPSQPIIERPDQPSTGNTYRRPPRKGHDEAQLQRQWAYEDALAAATEAETQGLRESGQERQASEALKGQTIPVEILLTQAARAVSAERQKRLASGQLQPMSPEEGQAAAEARLDQMAKAAGAVSWADYTAEARRRGIPLDSMAAQVARNAAEQLMSEDEAFRREANQPIEGVRTHAVAKPPVSLGSPAEMEKKLVREQVEAAKGRGVDLQATQPRLMTADVRSPDTLDVTEAADKMGVMGGPETAADPLVAKPGEVGYQTAERIIAAAEDHGVTGSYVNAISQDPGGYSRYVQDQVPKILKTWGVKNTDPDYDAQTLKARRQALNEVVAFKTVGVWTPPILISSETDPVSGWNAFKPKIEVVGFGAPSENGKPIIVTRQQGITSYAFDVMDFLQMGAVGAWKYGQEERQKAAAEGEPIGGLRAAARGAVKGIGQREDIFTAAMASPDSQARQVYNEDGSLALDENGEPVMTEKWRPWVYGAIGLAGAIASPDLSELVVMPAASRLLKKVGTVAEARKAEQAAKLLDEIAAARRAGGVKLEEALAAEKRVDELRRLAESTPEDIQAAHTEARRLRGEANAILSNASVRESTLFVQQNNLARHLDAADAAVARDAIGEAPMIADPTVARRIPGQEEALLTLHPSIRKPAKTVEVAESGKGAVKAIPIGRKDLFDTQDQITRIERAFDDTDPARAAEIQRHVFAVNARPIVERVEATVPDLKPLLNDSRVITDPVAWRAEALKAAAAVAPENREAVVRDLLALYHQGENIDDAVMEAKHAAYRAIMANNGARATAADGLSQALKDRSRQVMSLHGERDAGELGRLADDPTVRLAEAEAGLAPELSEPGKAFEAQLRETGLSRSQANTAAQVMDMRARKAVYEGRAADVADWYRTTAEGEGGLGALSEAGEQTLHSGKGQEAWRRFFDPAAIDFAERQSRGNSRFAIVMMAPDEFLNLAEAGRSTTKEARVADILSSTGKFEDLPFLSVHETEGAQVAEVSSHEGRHRMQALKALGVEQVPVVVRMDHLRWNERAAEATQWPTVLAAETPKFHGVAKSSFTMPFPESAVGRDGRLATSIGEQTLANVGRDTAIKRELIAELRALQAADETPEAAQRIREIKQQLDAIEEMGQPLSRDGRQAVRKATTAREAALTIAEHARSPYAREIALRLADVLPSDVSFQVSLTKGGQAGEFKFGVSRGMTDASGVTRAAFEPGRVIVQAPDDVETMLHEFTHAATANAIHRFMVTPEAMSDDARQAVERLTALFNDVKGHPEIDKLVKASRHADYGLTDVHEFIAEAFANPDFQEVLRKIPANELLNPPAKVGMLRSVYDSLRDAIRKLLGVKPTVPDSALDTIMDAAPGVFKANQETIDELKLASWATQGKPFDEESAVETGLLYSGKVGKPADHEATVADLQARVTDLVRQRRDTKAETETRAAIDRQLNEARQALKDAKADAAAAKREAQAAERQTAKDRMSQLSRDPRVKQANARVSAAKRELKDAIAAEQEAATALAKSKAEKESAAVQRRKVALWQAAGAQVAAKRRNVEEVEGIFERAVQDAANDAQATDATEAVSRPETRQPTAESAAEPPVEPVEATEAMPKPAATPEPPELTEVVGEPTVATPEATRVAEPEPTVRSEPTAAPASAVASPTSEPHRYTNPKNATPPAPGMVRMYHGGDPRSVTGSLWMTTDLNDAIGWSRGGMVWAADVPERLLVENYGATTIREAIDQGFAPLSRLEIPAEFASSRWLFSSPSPIEDAAQETAHGLPDAAQAATITLSAFSSSDPEMALRDLAGVLQSDLTLEERQALAAAGLADPTAFANAFIAWVKDPKSASQAVSPAMGAAADWLRDAFRTVKAADGTAISPEVSAAFSQLLGLRQSDEAIEAARQVASAAHEAARPKAVGFFKGLMGPDYQARRLNLFDELAKAGQAQGIPLNATELRKAYEATGRIDLPAPLFGRVSYDAKGLADLQAKLEDVALAALKRNPAKLTLDDPARMIVEETAIDKAWNALRSEKLAAETVDEAGDPIALMTRAGNLADESVKAIGRFSLTLATGQDEMKDLRHLAPQVREPIVGAVRVINIAYADAQRIMVDHGIDGLIKYLMGERMAFRGGRRAVSSGWDSASVLRMRLMDTVSHVDSGDLAVLTGASDLANLSPEASAAASRAAADLLYRRANLFTKQLGEIIGISQPLNRSADLNLTVKELLLAKTLTIYTRMNPEDGLRMLSRGVSGLYGPEAGHRVLMLMAGHGQLGRLAKTWYNAGLLIPTEDAALFKTWLMGEQITEAQMKRVAQVADSLGFDPNFVPGQQLLGDTDMPKAAHDRLMSALTKATPEKPHFLMADPTDLNAKHGLRDSLLTYIKWRKSSQVRGSLLKRTRFVFGNSVDQIHMTAARLGLGPSFAAAIRTSGQYATVLAPGVQRLVDVAQRFGLTSPDALEKMRDVVQSWGDTASHAFSRMVFSNITSLEMNKLMDGADEVLYIPKTGQFYHYGQLRQTFMESGVSEGLAKNIESAFKRSVAPPTGLKGRAAERVASYMEYVEDCLDAVNERERFGQALTLVELGVPPRMAGQLTTQALFDYTTSMTGAERSWLMNLFLPYWAFTKNATRATINSMFSPWQAHRLALLRRATEYGADAAAELAYGWITDPYGIDVSALTEEGYANYLTMREKIEGHYGGVEKVPMDVKMAVRAAFGGNSSYMIDKGRIFEFTSRVGELLRDTQSDARLKDKDSRPARMDTESAYIPRPDRSGEPTYTREFFALPLPSRMNPGETPRRLAKGEARSNMQRYMDLASPDHPFIELLLPETYVQSGLRQSLGIAALGINAATDAINLGGGLLAGKGPAPLDESGQTYATYENLMRQIVDPERALVLPDAAKELFGMGDPPPYHVHAIIGEALTGLGISHLEVDAAKDPFQVSLETGEPVDPELVDRLAAAAAANQLPPGEEGAGAGLKATRHYIPSFWGQVARSIPGFEEFNKALLNYNDYLDLHPGASPLERAASPEYRAVVTAARSITGVMTVEPHRSLDALREEPRRATDTTKLPER